MFAKWEKTNAIRVRDYKNILERLDRSKEMRDDRQKRLYDGVRSQGRLSYDLAMDLRAREDRQHGLRRRLYDQWEENIFKPLAVQAHGNLNPPSRAKEQMAMGRKSVAWNWPQEEFKMSMKGLEDPLRREVVDMSNENAFHQVAESVLGHSQSAPQVGGKAPGATFVLRRPLNPTQWGHTILQDTMCGHWEQKCAHGVGFRRTYRGGPSAHMPDDSDGVPCAGTRLNRVHGYGHKGILIGDTASRGESSTYKKEHGTSCGAPTQDHFNFETGTRATDLEFPLGKRAVPPGSLR